MDNKARQLKSMFRQRAEQRGLGSGSSGRPAKVPRREAPGVTGGASGSNPSQASRGGGGPPPGFFDIDTAGRCGGIGGAKSAALTQGQSSQAQRDEGIPSGFFDAGEKPAAPSKAEPEERNVLAMVMGKDSDDENVAADELKRSEPVRPEIPVAVTTSHSNLTPNDDKSKSKLSVPDSFFDSADAAKTARGEKVVKKSAEETMADFEADIEAELEEAKVKEQEQIELEALEKKERETEEQAGRLEQISRLKNAAAAAREKGKAKCKQPIEKTNLPTPVSPSDSDSEDLPDLTLDWRAKRV